MPRYFINKKLQVDLIDIFSVFKNNSYDNYFEYFVILPITISTVLPHTCVEFNDKYVIGKENYLCNWRLHNISII